MKEIFIKMLKELARIILTAFLAALGVQSTGCIACGDNASSSFVSDHH